MWASGIGAGVLLRLQERQRVYWLPGVGNFGLYLDRPERPPLIGGPLGLFRCELEIRFKPQARTRGLADGRHGAASTGTSSGMLTASCTSRLVTSRQGEDQLP